MAEIPSLVPLHCAFCLIKLLPMDRLRDVDRRAEVENSGPNVTNETRISRAGLRDSQAFFQCLRGTPFAHPGVP